MQDEDAYVRKTAATCVAKVYEINPQKVESIGLLAKLKDLLFDGNGMVVSNAVQAVTEITKTRGNFVKVDQKLVSQLLNAIQESAPWGRISILDFLSDNWSELVVNDETVQRIIPNLAHSNPAVVLAATRFILKYLGTQEGDKARTLQRKLAPPLISLMNNEPEI